MAFLEVLTIELGSSIAKAILKFWLKDVAVASDISFSLVDIMKAKTQDIIAQQHGKRQFEEIGEKVAQNLLPLFSAEETHISENSKEAVVLQVAQLLNNSGIDAHLLAERDLDGKELSSYLKKLHPNSTKYFSSEEESLFNRTLLETCQSIVDVASQLPSFSEQTLAEILRRENLLIKIVNQILEEVRRIRASSIDHDVNQRSGQFEVEYRRAVIRNLDEVELFGANVSKASRRHRLSVAYITLDVKRTAKSSLTEDKDKVELVYKTLKESPRLLLLGDAGSGKTTLLKWIAVKSASASFVGDLEEFNSYVPFFIRLRDFTDRDLPSPRNFPALISRTIEEILPPKWTYDRLRSGKAFILVDGLDEIPSKKREEVEKWLVELLKIFPTVRYMISSRPTAVSEGWNSIESFHEAYLQPMSENSVSSFIDHWHTAVQEAVEEISEKQELPSLAIHLKNTLREHTQLLSLARTPLLCALICALHRERRTQLPKDRIQLYSACTEMLLERREKESGIDYRGDYPELSYRHKEALIKDCAYWFIKNGWSSVEASDLDAHLSYRLQNMENIEVNLKAADVRRFFVERSGILREPTKGYIDFAHKTFQEFLAAKEILDQGDIGILINNALNSLWTDVVVLAAGLAPQKISDLIITSLIREGEMLNPRTRPGGKHRKRSKQRGSGKKQIVDKVDPNNEYRFYLLAASCLETVVSLSPHVKTAVQKKLGVLTHPSSLDETRKWAAAGDIAIPYLIRFAEETLDDRDPRTESINTLETSHVTDRVIASVRALTMMHNNRHALDALKNFAHDSRKNVQSLIVSAWGNFDREEYAKLILAENADFGDLIYDVPDFSGLHHLSYLEKIRVKKGLIEDLNGLQNLNLKYLSLVGCNKLRNLEGLGSQNNLEVLTLMNCPGVSDITYLDKLEKLQLLDMSFCADLQDLSVIANLKELRYLGLTGCLRISDFSFLKNLPNLRLLSVSFAAPETESAFMTQVKSLDKLMVLTTSTPSNRYLTLDELILRVSDIDKESNQLPTSEKAVYKFSERASQFLSSLGFSVEFLGIFGELDSVHMSREEALRAAEILDFLLRRYSYDWRVDLKSEAEAQIKKFVDKCIEMVGAVTPNIEDLILLYATDVPEILEQIDYRYLFPS